MSAHRDRWEVVRGLVRLTWPGKQHETGDRPMRQQELWHLLARYHAGVLTRDEAESFESWCATDVQRARVFRGITQLVFISRDHHRTDHTDAGWTRLQTRVRTNGDSSPRVHTLRLPGAAAPQRTTPARRSLDRSRIVALSAVAAALVVALAFWGVERFGAVNQPQSSVMRSYVTARGERAELGLPDGSRVILGAESELQLASARFTQERTLYLRGIAYFTVAHDPSHPFVVAAGGSATQAVGTAFTVRAYPEDSSVQVVVEQGRVLLRPTHSVAGSGVALNHGDIGRLDPAGVTSVQRDVDVRQYLDWTRGRLTYTMVPMRTIVRDLERWYDVAITIDDPTLRGVRMTVSFDRDRSSAEIVRRLADVLGARIVEQGRDVHLVPRHAGS